MIVCAKVENFRLWYVQNLKFRGSKALGACPGEVGVVLKR